MAIYLDCSVSVSGVKLLEGTEGTVVSLREKNGYHDSDFYATYWCIKDECPKTVFYATTRYGSLGDADVDATDDIKAKYQAYMREKALIQAMWDKEYLLTKRLLEVAKGDVVSIVRGRKHKGANGQVVWVGTCSYSNKPKVGVAISDKKDSKGFYVDVAWVLAEYCQKDGINYDAIKRRHENASNNSGIALSEVLYR